MKWCGLFLILLAGVGHADDRLILALEDGREVPGSPTPIRAVAIPQPEADKPIAKLSGPESAIEGDIIEIDASESTGASYYSWEVFDQDRPDTMDTLWREYEGGSKIVLAHRRGSVYRIRVIIGNANGAVAEKWKVVCESTDPTPGPTPDDDPPVMPLGVAKLVADAARKVTPPTNAAKTWLSKEAGAIANNYRVVIAQLKASKQASGQYKMTPLEADDALKSLNRSGLPDDLRTRWNDWMNALSVRLVELQTQEKMKTGEQVEAAFNEVAAGLEWVARKAGGK